MAGGGGGWEAQNYVRGRPSMSDITNAKPEVPYGLGPRPAIRTVLTDDFVRNLAAGYNDNIPIPHIKAVPEPLWCAELECYCCKDRP